MNQDWDIKPRNNDCTACHGAFADGQTYHARLIFSEAGYERGDFCDGCWARASAGQAHFSSWKGTFRVPPPEPERKVKKETAEFLLRDLIQQNDESKRNVIYILAVMLERQRLLVEREKRTENNVRYVVYEHRKTGESFVIYDPQLQLTALEHVQNEVMALLAGAPAPASTPPAPAPANV